MNLLKVKLDQYIKSITTVGPKNFDVFFSLLNEEVLKKGEYFAIQGRIEKRFGIITNGVVRTFYRSDSGEEHIISFGTAFSFIGGFSSLVSGSQNHINVQAVADCTILTAPYNEVVKLYSKHPEIETLARKLFESLLITKEKRAIQLLSLSAEKRYILFCDQYPELEAAVPQYYVASYLGITPTQLSRIRRKLLVG